MEPIIYGGIALVCFVVGFLIGRGTAGSSVKLSDNQREVSGKQREISMSEKPSSRETVSLGLQLSGIPDSVLEPVRKLVASGNYIEAIKSLRTETGMGLKESKEIVDQLAVQLPASQFTSAVLNSMPDSPRDNALSDSPAFMLNGSANADLVVEKVKELLRNGRKIEALKCYREMSGLGLKEAKDEVDRIERALRLGR